MGDLYLPNVLDGDVVVVVLGDCVLEKAFTSTLWGILAKMGWSNSEKN